VGKRNVPGQQLAFLQLRISHTRVCAVTMSAICFQVNTSGVGVSGMVKPGSAWEYSRRIGLLYPAIAQARFQNRSSDSRVENV
jgi:hypothetical protein